MEDQSYIKLFRSMLDWDWWDDLNVRSLWITILLMANWKDKKWRGIVIKKGSFFTSYEHLADTSGLSVQKVRTALNKLKSTGEITIKSTSRGTLVTIENWEKFQSWELDSTSELTSHSTNEQQTSNKRATNEQQQPKKDNKDKKDKKDIKRERFTPPTLEEVQEYIEEKGYHISAESFIDFYASKGWMVGKNKMQDWRASVRTWEKRRKDNGGRNDFGTSESKRQGLERTTSGSGASTQGSTFKYPGKTYGIETQE